MDLNQARERVERLTEDLNRWTYEYYVLDNPSHTDAEFDQAMEELQRLEKEFPSLVSPTSPTQRVGGQVLDSFKKIRHKRSMLSLGDIFNEDEIRDWDRKISDAST